MEWTKWYRVDVSCHNWNKREKWYAKTQRKSQVNYQVASLLK